jgi:predicted DNA-binding protein
MAILRKQKGPTVLVTPRPLGSLDFGKDTTMKAKRRTGVNDANAQEKRRVNVRLAPETYQRLGVHSVMSGKTPGEILDELVNKYCRDWKVSANVVARPVLIDSAIEGHSVDLSAAQAS